MVLETAKLRAYAILKAEKNGSPRPSGRSTQPLTWQDSARQRMKQIRQHAEKINLAAMTPASQPAATGYCRADKGKEYLVFQPGNQGQFSVDLRDARGSCAVR